jgi:7-cyano-7-deazaguanine synthase
MTTMKTDPAPACIVLLSGGLDSATVLAIAKSQGFACHAISFDYGQRHRIELDVARQIGVAMGVVSHRWVKIDSNAWSNAESDSGSGSEQQTDQPADQLRSALIDDIDVPKDRLPDQMTDGIPVTYVPARNTLFLSYALALAEVIGSGDVFIGVNAVDYSGYPDCRPQYIDAFAKMASLATKVGVEGGKLTIHTPLIDLTKVQIIEQGMKLNVDYALTHSCYDPAPTGKPCARCDACLLRKVAFEELGMVDPVLA